MMFVYLCLKILLEIHKDMVYKDMFRDVCLLVFQDIVGDSQGHGLQGHVVFMYVYKIYIFHNVYIIFQMPR